MGKTPFKLTYRVDAMIPVEIEEPNPLVIFQSTSSNALREEADLTNEAKEMAHIWGKDVETSDSYQIQR